VPDRLGYKWIKWVTGIEVIKGPMKVTGKSVVIPTTPTPRSGKCRGRVWDQARRVFTLAIALMARAWMETQPRRHQAASPHVSEHPLQGEVTGIAGAGVEHHRHRFCRFRWACIRTWQAFADLLQHYSRAKLMARSNTSTSVVGFSAASRIAPSNS